LPPSRWVAFGILRMVTCFPPPTRVGGWDSGQAVAWISISARKWARLLMD